MDFDPQRKGSFTSGSGSLCQISSKLVQNCDRESTETHTTVSLSECRFVPAIQPL